MRRVHSTRRVTPPFTYASRAVLGVLLALVAAGAAPPVAAQGVPCVPVQLVATASNVDLFVRDARGGVNEVRLAGLQPWPYGWPVAEEIPERVGALVRAGGFCLTPAAVDRTPNGVPLREAWLPEGRGSLAEILVHQGWAEVAPDAERTVPALAPILRAAEAEARGAQRGLWEVRAFLGSYRAPNGATFPVDQRLIPALDVLAGLSQGRQLLNALGQAGVPVFMAAEPPEVQAWAHYSPRGRVIWVDKRLDGADPRTIAVPLAHEASHAQDHFLGRIREERTTDADEAACYASEVRAFAVELEIWTQLFGAEGAAVERHRLEREVNRLLERYGTAPEDLESPIRRLYRGQCRVRPEL